jgi:hypothetical protein
MSKTNLSGIVNSVSNFANKHAPEILTGLGVAGMVTSTVLAVRATPKALQILEAEKKKKEAELTPVEIVKSCWKCYAPAAITGAISAACLIGASSVNAKRYAALTTAYKLSETALSDYREKVVETIGEKKEQAVQDKIVAKAIERHPVQENDIIYTGNGTTLCFDPMTSRYFYSSIESIRGAAVNVKETLFHGVWGYASLNDFYDELGLPHADVGDILGWNTDNVIAIDIGSHITDKGIPAAVIVYSTRPVYEYDR